jgi:methyltransferase
MVISERAYLALLAMLAGERMFELLLSRRNALRAFASGAVEAGQGHFAVMAVFHAAFIASCAAESIFVDHAIAPAVSIAALAFAAGAQVLRYAAVMTLGDRWNTRIIVTPGAAPVTGGIYRWVRHPNYIAVALELAAIPMIRGCWITALAFSVGNAVMMAVRIPAEERALGGEYAHAFAGVPRFFPRLRN